MLGLRHEKYSESIDALPYSLSIDLERTRYNCSREQNWHENPEIQLFTAGEGEVILNGRIYEVKVGDIIIVNSNDIHYTTTNSYLKYTCLIVGTDWMKRMGIEYDTVHFEPVIKNNDVAAMINKLADISTNKSDILRIARANEVLLCLLIELTEKYSQRNVYIANRNKNFDIIKTTVRYIQANFEKKLSLDTISKAVSYDKYALCREFKKYTGQTIIENLNSYRIMRAKEYLQSGTTVAETALLCGFENLSFFTRMFKRYTGKLPSYYKNKDCRLFLQQ